MKALIWIIIFLIIIVGGYFLLDEEKIEEKETIKIGVIAPITGVRAEAGDFIVNGVSMIGEEINNDSNRKYNLEFVIEDSQYDPKFAVSSIQKLINVDNVKYIVGPYGSSQVLAVAPIAEESKVIMITPGSQSDEVTDSGDYIFRNVHNTKQEAPIFAKFIADRMEGDTLHFIAINTAFSDSYLKNFRPVFEAEGKKIGLIERFDPKSGDFRTQLLKVKEKNPTDIFPIAVPKQMGVILNQAEELNIDANFYNIGVEGPDLVNIAGDLAEGIPYPYSYDKDGDEENIKTFTEKYFNEFKSYPDTIAANSYDAVDLISSCLENIGNDVDLVRDCLYETKDYKGASGTYSFDENGDAIKEIIIKTIKNGEFVKYEE